MVKIKNKRNVNNIKFRNTGFLTYENSGEPVYALVWMNNERVALKSGIPYR